MIQKQGNYDFIENLGSGSFGEVLAVKRKSDGKKIALKIVDNSIHDINEEIENLKRLSQPKCNPFLVCYYDSYTLDNKTYIEMELIEGDTLGEYIYKLKRSKPMKNIYHQLLLITKDLAKGLSYIHSKNIIHGDLKENNIMIDTKGVTKIIDFGLSCQLIKKNFCERDIGYYLAPETRNSHILLKASDMWVLGLILYQLATSESPNVFIKEGETFPDLISGFPIQKYSVIPYKPLTTKTPYLSSMKTKIPFELSTESTSSIKTKISSLSSAETNIRLLSLPELKKEESFKALKKLNTDNFMLDEIVNNLLKYNPEERPTADKIVKYIDAWYRIIFLF